MTAHRFAALDSLRGIAALGVAMHHLDAANGPASWALFRHGGLFVDFFFVLSGFVIAGSYGDRLAHGFSLKRFAALRIGRVWPLHAVMVLVGLALELAVMALGSYGLTPFAPFTGPHSPAHFLTALLLLDGFIPDWTNFYSRAGWSISVELLLYALAALAFRTGGKGLALLCLLGLGAAGALLAGVDAPIATTMVLRGLAGFALGTACWFGWQRLERRGLRGSGALEGLTLLGLFAAISLAPAGVAVHATIAASATVVLVFASSSGPIGRLLLTSPLAWLGRISYALYMVHAMVEARSLDLIRLVTSGNGEPIVGLSLESGEPVRRLLLAPFPSTFVQMAILALVLAAAHLAWRYVEEPARQWSRRQAERL